MSTLIYKVVRIEADRAVEDNTVALVTAESGWAQLTYHTHVDRTPPIGAYVHVVEGWPGDTDSGPQPPDSLIAADPEPESDAGFVARWIKHEIEDSPGISKRATSTGTVLGHALIDAGLDLEVVLEWADFLRHGASARHRKQARGEQA